MSKLVLKVGHLISPIADGIGAIAVSFFARYRVKHALAGVKGINARSYWNALAFSMTFVFSSAVMADAPYPPSSEISGMSFDWSTHDSRASGSDNWPITWADDNHQYTSWGDGGGFGGGNSTGRVSLGVARIEGDVSSYQGFNVWGGANAENPATFDGKSYGIISVDGVLYMWVSPGSDTTGYSRTTLHRSTNHGASWTAASWNFTRSDGLINPAFLQFGRDYQGSRDNYLYIYANHFKQNTGSLAVQTPGEIALMRVPKADVFDRSAYEFFAGMDGSGNPQWTSDLNSREPVFSDPNGVGWATGGVSYNAPIGRYFMTTEHTRSMRGNLGVFDAPEPWGPWTTVSYLTSFGSGHISVETFYWNFSNKWLSSDGITFTLVFSGVGATDTWNSVRGAFDASPGSSDVIAPRAPSSLIAE